jgi:ubiquinone/menaquinone biosynthesis C-methylase UbiE
MSFNAELFDRAAKQYDERPPFFKILGQKLVDFAELPEGASVLDVGAGKGAVTVPALRAVGGKGHVTATDVSDQMIQFLESTKAENLSVLHDDILSTKLPDSNFDHAVSGFTLHILGNLGKALSNTQRLLRRKGTLSWSKPGSHPDALEWEETYGHLYESFSQRAVSKPLEMIDEIDLGDIFLSAGFDVVEQVTVPVSIPVGGAEQYWEWTQTHGARWLTDQLDAADADEFRNGVIDSLLDKHPTQGRDIMVAPLFTKLIRQSSDRSPKER